jgi:hypothetical protein
VALGAGLAVLFVLELGVGAIVGLNLLRSEPEIGGTGEPPRQLTAPAERGAKEKSEEEANASQPARDERLGVGDSVEAEGGPHTLNGVRVLPTTDFDRPVEGPGNLFLATDLTFENVSDQPVAISSLLEFVLKNEEGYSASQSMHTQQHQLAEGELAPGHKTSGEIVYEVPPGSRGLQLDYRPLLRGLPTPGTLETRSGSRRPRPGRPRLHRPGRPPPRPSPRGPRRRSSRRRRTTTRPSTRRTGPTPTTTSTSRPGRSSPRRSGTSRTSSSPTARDSSSPRSTW